MTQAVESRGRSMASIASITDALRPAADGDLDILVNSDDPDESIQELVTAVNAALDAARSKVQKSEEDREWLQTILNLVPAPIFTVDNDRQIQEMNPAAERAFEVTAEEARGKECTEVFDCDCCAKMCGLLSPIVPKPVLGKVCELKFPPHRKMNVSKSVEVLTGPEGEVIGGVEILTDITPQVLMEEELRTKLVFIESLISTAPVMIMVTDEKGRITLVNRNLEEVSGFSAEELTGGDPIEVLFHPTYREEAEDSVMAGEDGTYMGPIQTASGDRREISWHGADLIDGAGGVSGRLTVGRDVTELLALEADLRQAQKLESVGRLASGIAHEINTPIQFVGDSVHFLKDAFSDYAELVSVYQKIVAEAGDGLSEEARAAIEEAEDLADREYLDPEVPKAIERILDGTQRVATIVRAMKEFGRPDLREKAPADLNSSIEATLTISRNEHKYVADLETDFGDLPAVTCHIGDINQVVLNLVVNAAHAIGDAIEEGGRGTIRVTTKKDGPWALLSISDTGTGIPEDIQSRIFDPFFTTKEVGKGTGQGLAIAHTIITEKHGGELFFETQEGKGTTFTIRLPIESTSLEESVTEGETSEDPLFKDAVA